MLGTDGMHSDMLQSAKAAYFVGQRFDPISPATACVCSEMSIITLLTTAFEAMVITWCA